MGPKYVLKCVQEKHDYPFVIYESALIGGQIMEKAIMRLETLDHAVRKLAQLGGDFTVAWSTQEIDNLVTVI